MSSQPATDCPALEKNSFIISFDRSYHSDLADDQLIKGSAAVNVVGKIRGQRAFQIASYAQLARVSDSVEAESLAVCAIPKILIDIMSHSYA